jgi:hypothetical protein
MILRLLLGGDPMDCREQLQPEGRLETINQADYPVESLVGGRVMLQKRLRIVRRAGHQRQLLGRRIAAMSPIVLNSPRGIT